MAHMLDGLDGARDGRRVLVGDGAEHGGGGKRRRGWSCRGMAMKGGELASRAQGEANQGVEKVGEGLWRLVDGGQGLPELEERAAVVDGRHWEPARAIYSLEMSKISLRRSR